MASALYWFDRYHVDGLRVDAVASMIYLDYSRNAGRVAAQRGRRQRQLRLRAASSSASTKRCTNQFPGAFMVAEESTAYDGITRPTYAGGVGFGFKWNMGWMHDTLEYLEKDPVYRKWDHHQAHVQHGLRLQREFHPRAEP